MPACASTVHSSAWLFQGEEAVSRCASDRAMMVRCPSIRGYRCSPVTDLNALPPALHPNVTRQCDESLPGGGGGGRRGSSRTSSASTSMMSSPLASVKGASLRPTPCMNTSMRRSSASVRKRIFRCSFQVVRSKPSRAMIALPELPPALLRIRAAFEPFCQQRCVMPSPTPRPLPLQYGCRDDR